MTCAWIWYWPHVDVDIKVDVETAHTFAAARQLWYQRERGGQLFADIAEQTGIRLIATPPHPRDGAGRTWCKLDETRCQSEIIEANSTGRRLIGYWHTHPQRIPSLSPRDIASFRQFTNRYQDVLPHPVSVIVGTSRLPDGIRIWSMHPDKQLEGIRRDVDPVT